MQSEFFSKPYTVSFYDTDFKGSLSIIALLRILNEAARDHAEIMGFGYKDLQKLNVLWVLSRIHIKINKTPRLFDKLEIKTRSLGTNHIFAFREFLIIQEDEVIVEAISAWLIIDPITRKFNRMTQVLKGFTIIEAKQHIDMLKIDDKCPENSGAEQFTRIQASELDFNGHMNAARYLERIYNSFDVEFHKQHILKEATIIYQKEATFSDQLAVLKNFTDKKRCVCFLVNKEKQEEMCKISLKFNE